VRAQKLTLSNWTHLAFSHSSGKDGALKVYLNGVPVRTVKHGPPVANSGKARANGRCERATHRGGVAAGRLFMGSPWVEPANAVVADVRYYKRVVDDGEVSRAFDDRLVGKKTAKEMLAAQRSRRKVDHRGN
jgi:hypothetical protein